MQPRQLPSLESSKERLSRATEHSLVGEMMMPALPVNKTPRARLSISLSRSTKTGAIKTVPIILGFYRWHYVAKRT